MTCIASPLAVVLLLITTPAVAQVDAPPAASTESTKTEGSFDLLEAVKARGSISRLFLRSSESFSGGRVDTPVVVLAGARSGPTLCVVAGIHGDEVNGGEVVRRTVGTVSPASLSGTLIAIPIANMSAFRRGSRYLPDRRDLNRYFPGRIFGSSAARIAYLIFDEVIRHCNALVDLHTGSFHRSNLHQLRADLSDRATMQLAADLERRSSSITRGASARYVGLRPTRAFRRSPSRQANPRDSTRPISPRPSAGFSACCMLAA